MRYDHAKALKMGCTSIAVTDALEQGQDLAPRDPNGVKLTTFVPARL